MLIKNQYDENIKFSAASIKQLNLLQRRIHWDRYVHWWHQYISLSCQIEFNHRV